LNLSEFYHKAASTERLSQIGILKSKGGKYFGVDLILRN
jgi:hypothetical protein